MLVNRARHLLPAVCVLAMAGGNAFRLSGQQNACAPVRSYADSVREMRFQAALNQALGLARWNDWAGYGLSGSDTARVEFVHDQKVCAKAFALISRTLRDSAAPEGIELALVGLRYIARSTNSAGEFKMWYILDYPMKHLYYPKCPTTEFCRKHE